MILPTIPTAILTDDETALYALLGERFRRRRRIEQALYRLAWTPAICVLMALILETR